MRCKRGFTLVELMIAMTLGIVILAAVITVFMAQRAIFRTSSSVASIQNSNNAISSIVGDRIRGAGFLGCGTYRNANSIIQAGSSPLIYNFTAPVFGFDARNTTVGGAYTISHINMANSSNTSSWLPWLDASLAGQSEAGSDVIVVSGETPGTQPIGVSNPGNGSMHFTISSSIGVLPAGTVAAISDCAKSTIFQITSMSSNSTVTVVNHASGGGGANPGNKSGLFNPQFSAGSQFVPLQQVAYFVGHGDGGQSTLYQATMTNGTWKTQPLVSGVDNMQILYGIGAGGVTAQYVPASAVSDWKQVNAVRLGFLLEGAPGSAAPSNPTSWNVLGTMVKVPQDTRLRHAFVMTVNLRNVTL